MMEKQNRVLGYGIRTTASGGWFVLMPGFAEFFHSENQHGYLGFFSSEEDLLEELEESTMERGEGPFWVLAKEGEPGMPAVKYRDDRIEIEGKIQILGPKEEWVEIPVLRLPEAVRAARNYPETRILSLLEFLAYAPIQDVQGLAGLYRCRAVAS